MLVSGGKILALGKVEKDETLKGNGTPSSPLGVSESYTTSAREWVKDYVSAVAGDTIPYSGVGPYISIQDHKVAFNSAGFATQQWVENKHYLTDVPDEYATKQWVEDQHYLTSVPEEYATKTDVSTASAAAVNSAEGIIKTWIQHNYWTSAATSAEIAKQLADFGGFEPVTELPTSGGDPKKIYLVRSSDIGPDKYREYIWNNNDWLCIGDTSMDLTPYAKTEDVNQQFADTSAWALATFHQPSGNYVTSAEFETYKTQVAGEFNSTSAWATETFQPKGEYVSATDFAELVEDVHELEDNVIEEFKNTSAWAESTFQPVGEYVSAADFAKLTQDVNGLSADIADYKTEVEQKFEDTSSWANTTFQAKGDYVSAEPFNTWAEGVDDALDTINDNFQSISADLENISAGLEKKLDTEDFEAWQEGKDFTSYSAGEGIDVQNHLISLASSALDNYYTKDKTSGAEALSAEFAKYQPAGEYITSADADERYLPMDWSAGKDVVPYEGDGEYIKVEDHKIILENVPQLVSVSSTDGSVDVSAVSTHEGITYDLSVKQVDETAISGENGVSAKYDEEEKTWLVGLTNYREKASWGQVTSDYTTYVSGSEKIIDLNAPTIVGDDIAISTGGDITLGEGLYHIDAQIDINVPAANIAANYYDVLFTIGNRSTIHELDASYAHAETVNLSFDIKVGASAAPIAMYIAQLPVGAQYKVRNFNIHEVVTIDALIEGGLQDTYDAGVGIQKYIDPTTSNPTFSAKIGLGLSADANGFFNVACGSGLKIDAQGGVMAVTLDEVTEEVVNTVTELKGDLDTKVTVNFDYSNIDDSYSFEGIGSTTGQGVLLGYLFAVPINAKVYTDSDATSEYETLIGVYSKQQYTQNYVMFGLYEYDPSYPQWNPSHTEISGYGRTVPLCDTGAVKLEAGFNEFPIKHLNNHGETAPELKSSCLYYATLYVSKTPGGGIMLAGCPGYKTTFNTVPQITLDQVNVNYDLGAMGEATREAFSFNDIGWGSWAGDTSYHELPSAPRFFMQVRNKKKNTTV